MKGLIRRFWEIDLLRGIAIVLMVVSNLVTDLDFFGAYETVQWDFWWFFARSVASVFLFLLGISLSVSYSRAKKELPEEKLFGKFFSRGAKIFFWGLLVTVFTFFFIPSGFVVFGVLHLIGAAVILCFPFQRSRAKFLFLSGAVLIALGIMLSVFHFDFPWLLWLGLVPKNFFAVDYFPLLPWFGVVLLGLAAGKRLYKGGNRSFSLPEPGNNPAARFFCFLGKNSLFIYLVHQPLIISALYFLGIIHPAFLP